METNEPHVQPEFIEHGEVAGVFSDLGEAERVPPRWILKDLLPEGMVVLAAPPKSYKSTLDLIMSLLVSGHTCTALPEQYAPVRTGRVVKFSYEATAGELRYIAEHDIGVPVQANESILIADDPFLFRLDDPDGINKLITWLDDLKPVLVTLDPLRDFHTLDENDSGAIIRALRPLQRWAKTNEACCLIIHHTKKRDEGNNTHNDWRGTSALLGMVDGCLTVTRKGEETINLSAAFKRGESYQRTLTLSVFKRKGESAEEEIGELERSVLKLLKAGAPNTTSIAKQIRTAKGHVIQALKTLQRNGLVTKEGKKWAALKRKSK
jgi:hypothetical protein